MKRIRSVGRDNETSINLDYPDTYPLSSFVGSVHPEKGEFIDDVGNSSLDQRHRSGESIRPGNWGVVGKELEMLRRTLVLRGLSSSFDIIIQFIQKLSSLPLYPG